MKSKAIIAVIKIYEVSLNADADTVKQYYPDYGSVISAEDRQRIASPNIYGMQYEKTKQMLIHAYDEPTTQNTVETVYAQDTKQNGTTAIMQSGQQGNITDTTGTGNNETGSETVDSQ
jgi:hypothetical protein